MDHCRRHFLFRSLHFRQIKPAVLTSKISFPPCTDSGGRGAGVRRRPARVCSGTAGSVAHRHAHPLSRSRACPHHSTVDPPDLGEAARPASLLHARGRSGKAARAPGPASPLLAHSRSGAAAAGCVHILEKPPHHDAGRQTSTRRRPWPPPTRTAPTLSASHGTPGHCSRSPPPYRPRVYRTPPPRPSRRSTASRPSQPASTPSLCFSSNHFQHPRRALPPLLHRRVHRWWRLRRPRATVEGRRTPAPTSCARTGSKFRCFCVPLPPTHKRPVQQGQQRCRKGLNRPPPMQLLPSFMQFQLIAMDSHKQHPSSSELHPTLHDFFVCGRFFAPVPL